MKINGLYKFTVLALVAIFGIAGCMAGTSQEMEHMGHAHSDMHEHGHEKVEVPEAMAVPGVNIEVTQDLKSGWNVHVTTENFRFAPENASMEHSPGEGHAHLYVDGQKIARLYAKWYHIEELSSGQHEISVTLNANDHREYAVNDESISASTIVVVP
jgi:hypothetical protein